ncbi:hypothetical protein [Limosilactobacillus fermentum]|uniref:hypothetical protein n=1 Tax=Limosilactobacillus fermentum TaxID=1613 RepID=UPI00128C706C|nr:hypothetical protein [Limosilactobacillus fermentum]MPW02614.1 hypothetical protein [Limosilactobacillus fermentum]
MAKTRKSQIKASRKYDKEHPQRVTYTAARRRAFYFLNAGPSSKVGQAIQAYNSEYLDDLKDLYQQVGEKIKRLTK